MGRHAMPGGADLALGLQLSAVLPVHRQAPLAGLILLRRHLKCHLRLISTSRLSLSDVC